MTLEESIHRAFNLMVTTVLFFGGIAFGLVLGVHGVIVPGKRDGGL